MPIPDYKTPSTNLKPGTMTSQERDALMGLQSPNSESLPPHATDPALSPAPADLPTNPKVSSGEPRYVEPVAVGGIFDEIYGKDGPPALRPADKKPPEQV